MTMRQHASNMVSWYLRKSPIQRGKHALWRATANRFLVTEVWPQVWMRTSGLTETEHTLFLRGVKEPNSVRFAGAVLQPGMVVLDVGANIGYYAMVFAQRVGPRGSVHAFEPTPVLADRLRSNAALNGFTNVTVVQGAVGDTPGTASLNLSADDPEANSLFPVGDAVGQEQVSIDTLDGYVKSRGIHHVDLLKIDCEGSELSVLRGASRLLETEDAPVVLLECNPESLAAAGSTVKDLYDQLRGASYDTYCLERFH